MNQKSVLGKGLASLIPGAQQPIKHTQPGVAGVPDPYVIPANKEDKEIDLSKGNAAISAGIPVMPESSGNQNKDRHPGISLADPELIELNPYQPRKDFKEEELKELLESIRENGIIQPLLVRKVGNGYQLIAGERRLRASKALGLKQVPVVIRRSTDKEALELAIVENVQREDLNCIEAALAYQQLMDEFFLTQEEVAKKVGKERASVANHLRLLKLPTEIKEDLRHGRISFGHGKVLLALEGDQSLGKIRSIILEKGLSVRGTEALISEIKNKKISISEVENQTEEDKILRDRIKNISKELTKNWSTKVEIKGTADHGSFSINFSNRNDFERILKALQEQKIWIK